ncbi:hypothetical protein N7460_004420 [Penicillium canescens]|uniref:Uncharacterized protein n=1 Tax=Penicillium canescens TaxID=5083 RepID=A0AAD6IBY8_PENCN|nr:hypothetical protein N7460_004420 [Penicillium canescens]KAJ6054541.1 hypothetical protein N7444_003639 [Penicillium canescens]
MDSATDDDEAVAPSGSQTNLSRKTLLRDTDDIGIHGDGESTCSSDETYSGPREKFLFNEVIDSQKPSDAPTSNVQAITMGLMTQLPSLPEALVSALLKIKTNTDSMAVRDALRFIRGVDAYGTDIANAGESPSTAHHNALLKEFAADIPMDSSIDHRIILPQVTQEPPVDTTAEDEEIALLLYEQLKKRC